MEMMQNIDLNPNDHQLSHANTLDLEVQMQENIKIDHIVKSPNLIYYYYNIQSMIDCFNKDALQVRNIQLKRYFIWKIKKWSSIMKK